MVGACSVPPPYTAGKFQGSGGRCTRRNTAARSQCNSGAGVHDGARQASSNAILGPVYTKEHGRQISMQSWVRGCQNGVPGHVTFGNATERHGSCVGAVSGRIFTKFGQLDPGGMQMGP